MGGWLPALTPRGVIAALQKAGFFHSSHERQPLHPETPLRHHTPNHSTPLHHEAVAPAFCSTSETRLTTRTALPPLDRHACTRCAPRIQPGLDPAARCPPPTWRFSMHRAAAR